MSISKTDSPDPVVVNQFVTYTLTVRNNGPGNASSVVVGDSHSPNVRVVGADPGCSIPSVTQVICNFGSMASGTTQSKRVIARALATGTATNTANVVFAGDPNPSNNTASTTTRITSNLNASGSGEIELIYKSVLAFEPDGRSGRGRIVWNGSHSQETGPGDFVYLAKVLEGHNSIEAHWTTTAHASATWRFDFSTAPEFVSGSLRVESGQVLFLDGSSIVFALRSGQPFPRFTFEIGEGRRGRPLR
jgi:uncharacterized repeat protein (TIGR01451 family)